MIWLSRYGSVFSSKQVILSASHPMFGVERVTRSLSKFFKEKLIPAPPWMLCRAERHMAQVLET